MLWTTRSIAQMSEQPSTTRILYRKPPIIERVVSVVGDVSDETFYSKFESWKEIILPRFPDYDPLKEWTVNIESSEGVPVVGDVVVNHRFWRKTEKGKRYLSMRLLPNMLTLNLHGETGKPRRFEELYAELVMWLPQWITHFGIKGCREVALDYINLLSRATTPSFVNKEGGLAIGALLNVFTGMPGRHKGIIPPYDCQMGLMIDEKKPVIFAVRVQDTMTKPDMGTAVRVDLRAQLVKDKPVLTLGQVLAETEFLHTVIIEQFEAIFSETAKKSFEPEA